MTEISTRSEGVFLSQNNRHKKGHGQITETVHSQGKEQLGLIINGRTSAPPGSAKILRFREVFDLLHIPTDHFNGVISSFQVPVCSDRKWISQPGQQPRSPG